jgi:excisionase family DNA binding protein
LGPTEVQAARHLQAIAAPPALLCVREVANILNVSTATVYTLAARGDLAHVRVLNAIRVAPVDLAQFIASHRRSS